MGKPIIAVGALGGTICMSAGGESGGVKPAFSAKDLVSAVPVLNTLAELHAQTLFAVASGSLKIENLLHALQWAEEQVKDAFVFLHAFLEVAIHHGELVQVGQHG